MSHLLGFIFPVFSYILNDPSEHTAATKKSGPSLSSVLVLEDLPSSANAQMAVREPWMSIFLKLYAALLKVKVRGQQSTEHVVNQSEILYKPSLMHCRNG